jgi:hypothetical protein
MTEASFGMFSKERMLGGQSTGQTTINRGDHSLAKINGKRLGHAC